MEIVPIYAIPKKTDMVELPKGTMAVFRVCQQMEALCNDKNGLGISAVQVGIPWNLFVAKEPDGGYSYFSDCTYQGISEVAPSVEGCLSILDSAGQSRRFLLDRFLKVLVKGQRLDVGGPTPVWVPFEKEYDGLFGVVMQHEIDHGNGVLISHIGREIQLW